MAFSATGLRRHSYGAPKAQNLIPVSIFHYATDDAAATVEAANYFNAATKQLAKGDVIMATMALAGTPVLKSYIVTSATGAATVVVALQGTAAG